MTGRVCEACGGSLLEIMRWRSDKLGVTAYGSSNPDLLGEPAADERRAFKCSGCGALSSEVAHDDGQGDLFEEVTE